MTTTCIVLAECEKHISSLICTLIDVKQIKIIETHTRWATAGQEINSGHVHALVLICLCRDIWHYARSIKSKTSFVCVFLNYRDIGLTWNDLCNISLIGMPLPWHQLVHSYPWRSYFEAVAVVIISMINCKIGRHFRHSRNRLWSPVDKTSSYRQITEVYTARGTLAQLISAARIGCRPAVTDDI